MDDSDFLAPHRLPTASRPLLGVTILVVEDSRYASEALRLLCLRSGARLRRADCLASARRHLQVYRPTAIMIDIGLPDGSGASLIAELTACTPRIPVILGVSGDEFAGGVALAAGADGFLAKPISSLAAFQTAILAHLPADRQPPGLRLVSDAEVTPDPMAYRDDLAHAAEALGDGTDTVMLDYVAQFLGGVAHAARDDALSDAAARLARARAAGAGFGTEAARLAGLVQQRIGLRRAI